MKKLLIVILVLFLVLQLSGCLKNPSGPSSQTITYTELRSPFNGNGNWYMTQAFGAYLKDASINVDGHHPGEDWNLASEDGDANEKIYAIAPGTVVGWGPVNKGDSNGSKAGFYLVIRHDGTFKIPGSNGAHIKALLEPKHESERASNSGNPILYAKDLFGMGELIDYDLGEKMDNGAYSYVEETVNTIYSVYMHINDPSSFINSLGTDKRITEDMLETSIGSLKGGMSEFPSHLHFEIRKGSNSNVTSSSLPGNINGYYANSQTMVDTGYREPSSIIQANKQTGDVLGETTDTSPAATTEMSGQFDPSNTADYILSGLQAQISYSYSVMDYKNDNSQISLLCVKHYIVDVNDARRYLKQTFSLSDDDILSLPLFKGFVSVTEEAGNDYMDYGFTESSDIFFEQLPPGNPYATMLLLRDDELGYLNVSKNAVINIVDYYSEDLGGITIGYDEFLDYLNSMYIEDGAPFFAAPCNIVISNGMITEFTEEYQE